ncbi:MAG: tRNA (N(6)-L-threonylcarbamoyladenosine(37)-C(2))-methylthiotransferase [Candidatus Micrarchaeaceae archaeon]
MKAYIRTYGCTLNQADSDIMRSVLERESIGIAGSEADADVVIVNTCTVKNATSQKILDKLKDLGRSGKKVVVTGCMAGANKDTIEKYAPYASIVTAPNMDEIGSAVAGANSGNRVVLDRYKKTDRLALLEPRNSVIARIPISDGCASSCSFCETKYARGPLNSFPERSILNSIEYSIKRGAREIQVTSQDIGAYGMDKNTNIVELMDRIRMIDGDFIVRVGMLNPEHLNRYFDGYVESLKDRRFYRFAHIPIQSGSDRVLRDMRRNYKIDEMERYMKEMRSRIPGITIETDMIVGFPTETDGDFDETVEFVRRARPEVTNISRFGARPHAGASRMEQNTAETINFRSAELSRVVRHVQREINSAHIGSRQDVLITESNSKSFNGRNTGYRQVVMPIESHGSALLGATRNVLIKAVSANVLYA